MPIDPMIAAKKFRPALKMHGGKNCLAHRIIERLPDHEVYVERFAGGLSVLLNKRSSALEVASDLNAGLIGFYHALRDRTAESLDRIVPLGYGSGTFAWSFRPGEDELDPGGLYALSVSRSGRMSRRTADPPRRAWRKPRTPAGGDRRAGS